VSEHGANFVKELSAVKRPLLTANYADFADGQAERRIGLAFWGSVVCSDAAHRAAATEEMQITRAKADDADVLTEIAHAAKRHWGYPERWMERWRDVLTMRPAFITANIAYCAIADNRVVGFYILTTEDDGLHLDHLWILPAAIRRGLGRALFEHAADQAKRSGFDSIKIEADPNAEGFYQRMGAERVGLNVTEIEGERRELPLLVYAVPL
jgi:ribosomal protein S18 acetylase RimI-like enzyme